MTALKIIIGLSQGRRCRSLPYFPQESADIRRGAISLVGALILISHNIPNLQLAGWASHLLAITSANCGVRLDDMPQGATTYCGIYTTRWANGMVDPQYPFGSIEFHPSKTNSTLRTFPVFQTSS